MGYRSQVRCLIYGTKDNLDAYITEASLINGSTVLLEFKEALSRYTTKAEIYGENKSEVVTLHVLDLYGDDWKWYESYPDVQAWMKLMHESVEADLQYEFIRVGENDDDIERHSSEEQLFLLSLSVHINDHIEKIETISLNF
jgi:hypothetical protein